jgi:ABC-type Fe3+-citrate transport system substrate-binding protein
MNATEAKEKSIENRKRIKQKEKEERELNEKYEAKRFEESKLKEWNDALDNINCAVSIGASQVQLVHKCGYDDFIKEKLKKLGYKFHAHYEHYDASRPDPDSGEGGYDAGTNVIITVQII